MRTARQDLQSAPALDWDEMTTVCDEPFVKRPRPARTVEDEVVTSFHFIEPGGDEANEDTALSNLYRRDRFDPIALLCVGVLVLATAGGAMLFQVARGIARLLS